MNVAGLFLKDQAGTVTIDWIVGLAAVVGLGIAVLAAISTGSISLATEISDSVDAIIVDPSENIQPSAEATAPDPNALNGWHGSCYYENGQVMACA